MDPRCVIVRIYCNSRVLVDLPPAPLSTFRKILESFFCRGGCVKKISRDKRHPQLPMGVKLTKETRGCSVAVRRLPGGCRIPLGLWRARPSRSRDAVGLPVLNAQSPSQRSNGDCAFSLRTPVASSERLRWAHHLVSWIRQPPDRYRSASRPHSPSSWILAPDSYAYTAPILFRMLTVSPNEMLPVRRTVRFCPR